MPTDQSSSDLQHEQELLRQYTHNLRNLEQKAAQFGILVPTAIQNEIQFEQSRIDSSQQRVSLLLSQDNAFRTNMSAIEKLILDLARKIQSLEHQVYLLQEDLPSDNGTDDLVISTLNIRNIVQIAQIDASVNEHRKWSFAPFAWHPTSTILAIPEWHTIEFYNEKGQHLHSIDIGYKSEYSDEHPEEEETPVRYIEWSTNGRILTFRDNEGYIRLWGIKQSS